MPRKTISKRDLVLASVKSLREALDEIEAKVTDKTAKEVNDCLDLTESSISAALDVIDEDEDNDEFGDEIEGQEPGFIPQN